MSCIAGVVHLAGGEAPEGVVPAMLQRMAHRAPDGRGVWASGSASLGHGMMHTTPESLSERQPLVHREAPLVLAADARVDNRDDLLSMLGLPPAAPDSAVILEAYVRWGARCVEHLVGDYAFAVWDATARRLFCARDEYGTRPLFYAEVGDHLALATELKAFQHVPGFEPRPNETRIADFLAFHFDEPTHTMLEGVWRLPAAHTLSLDLGTARRPLPRIERHYTFEPCPGGARRSDEAYVEELKVRFREAVRCRMRSAFPVGVQLSGGLDSSAVTAFAREIAREVGRGPLPTFSLSFEAVPAADERKYVYPMVEQGGLEAHYVPGDETGPLDNVASLAPLLDDGPAVGTQHLVWAMLQRGAQRGLRVMLDGIDGDNVISHGELRLREQLRHGDWEGYRREAHALGQRYVQADHKQDFEEVLASERRVLHGTARAYLQELAEAGRPLDLVRGLQSAYRHTGLPRKALLRQLGPVALTPRALRRTPVSSPATHPHIAPALAERVGLADRLQRYHVAVPHTTVREAQSAVLGMARMARAVELAGDYAAAAGIELRHPFFDRRLVEFTLSLPADLSLRDGWTRYILRRAIEEYLPDPVAWRMGKASMEGVYRRGLVHLNRGLIAEAVAHLAPVEPYVRPGYVRELASRPEALSGEELTQLHAVCGLALWGAARG